MIGESVHGIKTSWVTLHSYHWLTQRNRDTSGVNFIWIHDCTSHVLIRSMWAQPGIWLAPSNKIISLDKVGKDIPNHHWRCDKTSQGLFTSLLWCVLLNQTVHCHYDNTCLFTEVYYTAASAWVLSLLALTSIAVWTSWDTFSETAVFCLPPEFVCELQVQRKRLNICFAEVWPCNLKGLTLHTDLYPVDELIGLAAVQQCSDGWQRVQNDGLRMGIDVVLKHIKHIITLFLKSTESHIRQSGNCWMMLQSRSNHKHRVEESEYHTFLLFWCKDLQEWSTTWK